MKLNTDTVVEKKSVIVHIDKIQMAQALNLAQRELLNKSWNFESGDTFATLKRRARFYYDLLTVLKQGE